MSKEGCRQLAGVPGGSPGSARMSRHTVQGSWSVQRAGVSLRNPGTAAGLSP